MPTPTYGMGFTGPWGAAGGSTNPNVADPLGGDPSITGPANPFGNTNLQAGTTSGFFYDNPTAGLGHAMQQAGMNTDSNNYAANVALSLAPGLKWLDFFNDPTGVQSHLQNDFGSFLSGTAAGLPSGFGGAASALNTLFGASGTDNPLVHDMMSGQSAQQINQMIGQIVQAAGFGTVNSDILKGLSTHLTNAYNQYLYSGAPSAISSVNGVTDADTYLKYLMGAGDSVSNLMSWVGLG